MAAQQEQIKIAKHKTKILGFKQQLFVTPQIELCIIILCC